MTKAEWLERNNFCEEGLTWIICGGDTYAIKDQLKELGFKFSPLLKWHIDRQIEIPEGYSFITVSFNEVYEWSALYKNAFVLRTAQSAIDAKMKIFEKPSLSEHVGEIGERLRNREVTFVRGRSFESRYGLTNIYVFQEGENLLHWFTQSELKIDVEPGQQVLLTGTVKKHEEYKGSKVTQLSRCIIKEI